MYQANHHECSDTTVLRCRARTVIQEHPRTKYIGSHLEIDCSGKRGLQKVAKASERQNPVILDHVARALTTEIPSSDTAPEAQEDNKIELICAMRVTGGLYRAECDVDCAFAQLWVLVLKSIA